MSHGRWQKSPQWGPSAQNRARFVRKYDNGASTLELKWRVEPEIGIQSAIRASIQGTKKNRRVAERPHCAAFCHNRPSMPQQTSQNTNNKSRGAVCLAAPWSMAHGSRVMTLRSNSPMVPLATIALWSHSPRAQSSFLPHKLRHKPKPDLTHQPGLPGTKNISQTQKSHPVGWLSSFDGVGGGI